MRRIGTQQTEQVLDAPKTPLAETTPAPALVTAFFHKSPLALYDITAPIPASNTQSHWSPFSRYDCAALEEAYQKKIDGTLVGIERLHQVSLESWSMQPVYWSFKNASATSTPVYRGTWFYAADSQPVPRKLAAAIETGYQEVRPWTEAYEAELASAQEIGSEAEAKLRYLVGEKKEKYVIYRDSDTAWLGTRSLTSRLATSIYASIGRHRRDGYVELHRGYKFTKKRKASRTPSPRKDSPAKEFDAMRIEEGDGIPEPRKVTDLILVIHGIGQKLAETSEGWTFTHAVNRLRLLLHEQLTLADTLRDDFCPQILPVNWRMNLDLESESEAVFTLEDITIDSIPAVRDLIGKVVFDIPYYMSHHKPRMIAAVVREANRVYALWLKNNPEFDKTGRVHVLCHSLGAAISFDILSNQPNDVKAGPSFYDTISRKFISEATQKAREGPGQFAFNTCNLICAGSPAAFFLLLQQKKLMPRRGLKDKDASNTEVQGRYGCLAVQNIYNVFYNTDPIAYRLSGTVDSSFAKTLPPTLLPSHAAPFLSKLFSSSTQVDKPRIDRLPSQVELEEHDFSRESAAEKRLNLLNENGQLDYILPNTGFMDQQYLNMIYAHQGYWDSREFARLIVIECGRTVK